MKPPSVFDPSWKYTPSGSTNISATFKRVRAKLKEQAEAREKDEAESKLKITKLNRNGRQ